MSTQEEKKTLNYVVKVKRVISADRIEVVKDDKIFYVKLAGIMVPHFKMGEKAEEQYAYEAREHVRKMVIGNQVKITEKADGKIKIVTMKMGKTDIAESLLKSGYVAVSSKKDEDTKKYLAAQDIAKAAKKGIWGEKMGLKETQFEASKLSVGSKINVCFEDAITPSQIKLITENRQVLIVNLAGIYIPMKRNEGKLVFDEIAKEGIEFLRQHFVQRNVELEVFAREGKKLSVVLIAGKKNVNLEMVKLGYALVSKDIEEVFGDDRIDYLAGQKFAQKNKSGRWENYDEAAELAKKKEIEEKAELRRTREKEAELIVGEFVESKGTTIIMNVKGEKKYFSLASLHEIKRAEMLLKEALRKKMIGKYFMKKVYEKTHENKKGETVTDVFVDLIVDRKNYGNELIRNGLVKVNFTKIDEEKSFAYDQFVATYDEIKNNKITYPEIRDLTNKTEEVKKMKDSLKASEFTAVVQTIFSSTKYTVYVPSKDIILSVFLAFTKMPIKDIKDEQVKTEGRKAIRELIANKEVVIDIEDINDKGMINAIVKTSNGIELNQFVLEEGYCISAGKNDLYYKYASEAKEAKKGLWAIEREEAPKKEKKIVKKVEKNVFESRKLEEAINVYMTGFDGREVYYYASAEEAKCVEQLGLELFKLEKKPFEIVVDQKVVVEINKKFYRAVVLAAIPKANVVKCIDTGLVAVVGKNKLRPISDELANKEVTVKSVKLVGMKFPAYTDIDFNGLIKFVNNFANKLVAIKAVANEQGSALVEVDGVNVAAEILKNGLGYTYAAFKDNSEWGLAMTAAQAAAKEAHINVWRYGDLSDAFDEKESEKKN